MGAEGDSECKPSYYRYRQSCSYLACWFVLIRLARRRRNACFSRTQIFAKNVTCGPTDSLFLREIVIFSTANHYIIERKQAREAFLSSRMAADCGIVVAKYCLKLFNFLFFIAGAILLSVGFWLAIDKNSFVRLLTKISQDTTLHQFSQPTVIEQASWILIAAGGFVFVLSCLGYCGAYQESPFMLGTYSILVVAILALEITAAGLAINYKTEADTNTREFLKSTISKYYATADKADAVTLMWNYLMAQFKCCGVENYRDFSLSEKWQLSNKVVPNACCVLEGDIQLFKPKDPACPDRPSESNSYYNKGCYQALYSWVKTNLDLVIAVCLSLASIQVLGIIFACCLCHKLGG